MCHYHWCSQEDWQLFGLLYQCWCHNAAATIALCLLTQNYQHVSDLIDNLYPLVQCVGRCIYVCGVCVHLSLLYSLTEPPSSDIDVTAGLLGELDRLIQLIESPIFTCQLTALLACLTSDRCTLTGLFPPVLFHLQFYDCRFWIPVSTPTW